MADAMAPGSDRLPPAGELDVVGPVSRYLAGLPPRPRIGIRLALGVFEWLPFPWRFSRLAPDARERFLSDMDSSGTAWQQDLLLLMKILAGMGYGSHPRVREAIGYEMVCERDGAPSLAGSAERSSARAGDPPSTAANHASPLGDLSPPADGEECDVVIVGSGAGGAVAATVLAEAGLDVVVLEAGPYLDRRSYPDDPLEALQTLYRDNGLTVAEGRPTVPFPLGRAVGGTTVVNSGTCFRTPPRVLRRWSERCGIGWAERLDGDFAEVEEMLDVAPVDVETMGRNGQVVMEGAAALGVSGGPLSRNAGSCKTCSSCPSGCRLDAKRAMHVSYLPRAVAAGARVRAGVEALEVLFERGRATGVRCQVVGPPHGGGEGERPQGGDKANGSRPRRGRPFEVRARCAVVLAAGAVGTPELLLRSGVRSPSGMIGRDLHVHPAAWIGARFDEEIRGWDGIMQSYYVDEWADMGLLMEATFTPLAFGTQWLPGTGRAHHERVTRFDRVASNGVHLSDSSAGRVSLGFDGATRITYRLSREEARKLVFGVARAAEIFFAAGADEVYSQVRGIPVIARGRVADFEAADPPPDALRLEAFHPMGTAKMDADPARGVTGPDGAVHGRRGLYVADASLLPTSLGVNPMITIAAVAAHVARDLAESVTA